MADFEGGLPIKSARDGDVKIQIVPFGAGDIATVGLGIDENGAAKTSLQGATGNVAVVNPDGSLNVVMGKGVKVAVTEPFVALAVAKDAEASFDYTVTTAKTFTGFNVLAGSRGACKVDVGTFDGTTFTRLATYFQLPAQNRNMCIPAIEAVGDGTLKIRVTVTNFDQATDLYATIQGYEE